MRRTTNIIRKNQASQAFRKPYLLLSFFWLFLHTISFSQPGPLSYDQKTEELIILGKKYLQTKNFKEANQTFILANQRPENQLSSTALYYLAISWYYIGEKENALNRIEQLLKEYPQTKYKEEAIYHKALLSLGSEHVTHKERGLDNLFRLADTAEDPMLREQALDAAKHHVFNVLDYRFLDLYFLFVKEKYRWLILEGICHRLDESGDKKGIVERIKSWTAEGQVPTPYMNSFKGISIPEASFSGKEIHIAIFLSFHLYLADTARSVPPKSLRALQFYEGIRFAIDKARGSIGPTLLIKVFDTQNDTSLVRKQLVQLKTFQPDLIIGDIGTSVSQVLGNWAEENKVVQFVPRNPLDDLIESKKFIFLFHPSVKTHGIKMAEYVTQKLGKKNLAAFNDKTHTSEEFFQAFKNTAEKNGATVREFILGQKFDQYRVNSSVSALKSGGFEGIYIPLENEENVGLLLSQLALNKTKIQIFGTPAFENFPELDEDLLTDFKVTWTAYYSPENDTLAMDILENDFITDYHLPPQAYNVQGYDLLNYFLFIASKGDGIKSLAEIIRNSEPFHGNSQDVHFSGNQCNQEVSIVLFQDGRIIKID